MVPLFSKVSLVCLCHFFLLVSVYVMVPSELLDDLENITQVLPPFHVRKNYIVTYISYETKSVMLGLSLGWAVRAGTGGDEAGIWAGDLVGTHALAPCALSFITGVELTT